MWTNAEWSQRHIDKKVFEKGLNDIGLTVLGWTNRKPLVISKDGQAVDWRSIEELAEELFMSRPVIEAKPIKASVEKPKPVKRSRKKASRKKQ